MHKRLTIDPQDITALEYECGRCHSRHIVPINSISATTMKCPTCHYEWVKSHFNPATSEKLNLSVPRFAQVLKELYEVGDVGPDKDGAKIRLELKVGLKDLENNNG
jgi:hypothetical protein